MYRTVFSTVFAKDANKVIHQKDHNGHYHRQSESSFSNDGTQRSTNKEQNYAGEAQGDLLVKLNLMKIDDFVISLEDIPFVLDQI